MERITAHPALWVEIRVGQRRARLYQPIEGGWRVDGGPLRLDPLGHVRTFADLDSAAAALAGLDAAQE